ncbi:trimethylamine methyltransferase family protein [Zhaonella formicivorans]|uniref:trimethylamine methyltransferase family protein n=1 Tax=Zhaonella formicivorans TaxID=2528593 RepID=UPI0010E512A9|nr:trimethylamine methyltransferase family protein [Zhaonella formicivorans]
MTAKSLYVRANYEVNQTPQFKVLSDDQCEEIYLGALETLERTGADVYSKEALELLAKGGCWVDGTRVRFPSYVVEKAIRSVPSRIVISDRNGVRTMFLEDHNIYYGPGSGSEFIIDFFNGERRRPQKSDVELVGRIVDAMPNMDFAMELGTCMDVTPTLADVHAFEALVRNTTKPIIQPAYGVKQCQDILDMAAAVAGSLKDLQQNPFIIFYTETSSPLRHFEEALDKTIFAAKNSIPNIYAPSTFAGGVAPVTLAGTILIALADNLVGLVVSQLAREGAPFIMGGIVSTVDISDGMPSYGAPEASLLAAGFSNVASYLGLLCSSIAGCSDSKCFDAQMGLEAASSLLVGGLSGSNIIQKSGKLEYGATGSLELIVMNDETIGMVKRILRGIQVNDETMAVDVIDCVGPGGHFLGEEHTMKYFRTEFWRPTLMNRFRYDEWKANGGKTMAQRVKEKTQNIINNHRPEPLPEKTLAEIKAIVERAESREATRKKK